MVTPNEERRILDDLQTGLALAVRDHPNLDLDALEYTNETKLQKLLYMAVDQFELPVTYSWYLAGAHIANESVSLDQFEDRYRSLQPSFNEESRLEDKRVKIDEQSDIGIDIEDYRIFYREQIEEVWFTPLNSFLEEFYTSYCPKRFRNIYLKSLYLRQLFEESINNVESVVYDKQSSLSQFLERDRKIELYQDFKSGVDDLELELAADSLLQDTAKDFQDFGAILLKLIEHLESKDIEQFGSEDLFILEEANEFYFFNAWRQPALYIAKNTAQGPNAHVLRSYYQEEIECSVEGYQQELQVFKDDCEEFGVEMSSNKSNSPLST